MKILIVLAQVQVQVATQIVNLDQYQKRKKNDFLLKKIHILNL